MIFVGVDPGKSGAIAAINAKRKIILVKDYPNSAIFGCCDIIREIMESKENPVSLLTMPKNRTLGEYIQGAIERAQSMPKQGVRGMFNYGVNYGDWRGCFAMAGIPFEHPTPQMWRKGLITTMGTAKNPSIDAARRLFPDADLFGPKGGAKDGRAEALLIAEWLRRRHVVVKSEQTRRRRRV
jgi:hypothetical protein